MIKIMSQKNQIKENKYIDESTKNVEVTKLDPLNNGNPIAFFIVFFINLILFQTLINNLLVNKKLHIPST